ncbi:OmpH family outer membrane protein [Erythrobacter sp. JK5]|uniref:OmpH family outer membrane protein n=1 Tax=Erythrobacter sp. JK5 TaxID=2829500 RepID=UPI001BA682DA|nr:OmpH family outer membrane protein [Erythrobacter sp. JK5]QUL39116.1 OmpH family outer membrane protein [Erythrobacter sp. JK5]
MKLLAKSLAAASLAACAVSAAPAIAQVQGRIATVDVTRAIIGTSALQTAYNQVSTTYSAQIETRRAKNEQRQTLLQGFDTNNDNEVNDAELQAAQSSPQFAQLQTLEQEIAQLSNQIDSARVYAIEQIFAQYPTSVQEVVTQQQIQMVFTPGSVLYAPPAADITQQVTTSLNTKVPSVQIVPPAGWQPSRQGVQLFQDIQQTLVAAQVLQQRQQAAQQGNQQSPKAARAGTRTRGGRA